MTSPSLFGKRSDAPSSGGLSALLKRFDRYVQPSAQLDALEDVRRARVLASLAFSLALILTISAVISVITTIFFPDPTISLGWAGTGVIAISALSLWISYFFSRSPRYLFGAWAFILVLFGFVTSLMLLYPLYSIVLAMGYALTVLVATLFLNLKGTTRVFVAALTLMTVVVLLQRAPIVSFSFAWGVGLSMMLLLLLVSLMREDDLRQVRRLRELEASEGERLRRELELARKVQIAMLPKQLPNVPQLEIAAYSKPSQEASGDFYDVFLLQHERGSHAKLGVVVCDVAGKGMSSALVMSATRAAIRAEAERSLSPASVLAKVNVILAESIPSGLFVTLFYGIYDPLERRLCYASAGHPHPLWWHEATVSEMENYGMPLGLVAECEYQDVSVTLAEGDSVFIYTDGLVEAMNPAREMFGFERAQRVVKQYASRHLKPNDLVGATIRDMENFVQGEHQQDDVTIVVLQVKEG